MLLTDAPAELSTTEAGSLLLRTGLKRFFFDTFSNAQGTFLRITEVWVWLCGSLASRGLSSSHLRLMKHASQSSFCHSPTRQAAVHKDSITDTCA